MSTDAFPSPFETAVLGESACRDWLLLGLMALPLLARLEATHSKSLTASDVKVGDFNWRIVRGNATWISSLGWRPERMMVPMTKDPRVLKSLSPQHTFAIFSNSLRSYSLIPSRCVS